MGGGRRRKEYYKTCHVFVFCHIFVTEQDVENQNELNGDSDPPAYAGMAAAKG